MRRTGPRRRRELPKNGTMIRISRFFVFALATLASSAAAVAADRLFEREPYDCVIVNEGNEKKRFDVETLPRPKPSRERSAKKLRLRLLDNPDKEYEVAWRNIDHIELFEERVLAEAKALVEAGNFEDAYDYFAFLREEYPKMPNLKEETANYLYREAFAFFEKGEHASATARLLETYHANPQRKGLDNAFDKVAGPLVDKYLQKKDYESARKVLETVAECYPNHPLVRRHESALEDRAGKFLAQAKTALEAKDYHAADAAIREVFRVWPNLSGATELRRTIQDLYPRIVVGVTSPAPKMPSRFSYWDNWSCRRTRRLTERTLMEFKGPGAEGGEYVCPFGEFETSDLGRRLTLQIRQGIRWSEGSDVLTGTDVARRLFEMADPRSPVYNPVWRELSPRVSVEGVFTTHIDLPRLHVCPGGMLRVRIPDYGARLRAPEEPEPTLGPFRHLPNPETESRAVFQATAQYFAAVDGGPKEIVEWQFSGAKTAVGALKAGEVALLDRVCPWDVPKLREVGGWKVGRYKTPLIHCLVPNYNKPLTGHRGFRRALVYAINREAILTYLLGGGNDPGNRVVSGPFPPGEDRNDAIGYAYDRNIAPRGFDPTLAIALIEVSIGELIRQAKKQGTNVDTTPKLTLVHPADEVARAACAKIQENLKWAGLTVTLKEYPPGETPVMDDETDLIYAELAVWEPVADVEPLLGMDGLSGGITPYMSLALKQLRAASDWRRVGTRMRQVHRIAYNDVAVVPLWQLYEYFVHTPELTGVGDAPVTLYENVEQWRLKIGNSTEEHK